MLQKSDTFSIEKELNEWIGELKHRIRCSQIKASIRVNVELLELYWSIGSDIVTKRIEEKWGSGVIPRISEELRTEFPSVKGFSSTNLWYIKKWYLFYSVASNSNKEFLPQLVGEIPWGHHREIITHCKSIQEALFYIHKTIEVGWSRSALIDNLKAKTFLSQGQSITNFSNRLPILQGNLAQETLKDPYRFDFLALTEGYKEKELENTLVANITEFLLELGRGFAFIGRQVEVAVGDSSYFIDMLFYHYVLKSFVVVELKTVKFQPEFAGKLNFYVTAVDRNIKSENDNPTIGLLICKDKDDILVEYSLSDIHKPVGVSTYHLTDILPSKISSILPSIEEIENKLGKEI